MRTKNGEVEGKYEAEPSVQLGQTAATAASDQQADNAKPRYNQTNTTQVDGSRVNRKPQQQANSRVPSRLGKPQAVCPSCADVLLCGNNGSITCQSCKKNFSWCAR